MPEYVKFRRKGYAEMTPWTPGFDMAGVSVSDTEAKAGSPHDGDMIARNPNNHDDKWLVARQYFLDNFEP